LIDNIFIQFGELVFQQPISILVGTNYAPLLADLFLHANGAEYLQVLLKNTEKKTSPDLKLQISKHRWCSVTDQCSIVWLSAYHLSTWPYRKGHCWHSKVWFLPWPSHWNRQRRKMKIKTLPQTWSLHFSHSQLPFYQLHYSSVWSLHFTTQTLF